MIQTPCPECEAPVDLHAAVRPSEIVLCSGCDAELEVLSTAPLTIALAPEIEEDWGE